MPIIKNNTQPLVVPFEFNGEDQLAIHRDFWRLPISAGAKGFYLVMLSQEPNKTFSVEERSRRAAPPAAERPLFTQCDNERRPS